MTLLSHALNAKEFDVRLQERNISKNVISHGDVEKNAKQLPDDSENADYTNTDVLMSDVVGQSGLR